jgi:hypothetical protein
MPIDVPALVAELTAIFAQSGGNTASAAASAIANALDGAHTDGAGGAVDSVNGETGAVVLDAGDVGADPAGTASAERADHESDVNHANLPTSDQKAALAGTGGTPSGSAKYAVVAGTPTEGAVVKYTGGAAVWAAVALAIVVSSDFIEITEAGSSVTGITSDAGSVA